MTQPKKITGLKLAALMCLLAVLGMACQQPPAGSPGLPELTAISPTPRPTSTRFATVTPRPTAAPTTTPVPTATPEPVLIFEGLFFDSPPAWGEAVETALDEMDGGPGIVISWPDFPGEDGRLAAVSARAAASRSLAEWQAIDQLRGLLTDGPPAPFVQPPPALTMLDTGLQNPLQPAVFAFENGRGMRYLAASPSGRWHYRFQGLTSSGADYVFLDFPLQIRGTAAAPAEVAQLQPEAFEPSLDTLDRLAASVTSHLPPPAVDITSDGRIPLTLFYPSAGGVAVLGESLAIEGFTQPGQRATLLVTLTVGEQLLASDTYFSDLNGSFVIDQPVPRQVLGAVTLTVAGAGGRVERQIAVVDGGETGGGSGPALTLAGAETQAAVAAGFPLFFEGSVENPVGERVTLVLLVDGCSVPVAQTELTVPAPGGEWFGYLVVPDGIRTEGCAVAYTGLWGEDAWRAAVRPVEIVGPGDERAASLVVGNPRLRAARPGEVIYVAGSASGSPLGLIRVDVVDRQGMMLNSEEVTVNQFGLWEALIVMPDQSAAVIFTEVGGEEQQRFDLFLEE